MTTSVDPMGQAIRYVIDGWPETEAAERNGVDVDELRAALADRDRAEDADRLGQRDTRDTPPTTQEPQQPPASRQLRGANMSTVEAEPIHWLWPGYLARGKLHILDGDPGLGKSTVTLDLAARLTVGAGWPDGAPGGKPTSVVLLSAEDDPADTIRPRLDLAGADCARVYRISCMEVPGVDRDGKQMQTERQMLLPDDVEDLAATVRQQRAGLLIIDPLMAYLSGDVNSYRDQDVRRALAPLARMAERCDVAVVLVRHLNKSNGSNAVYRGGGSIGIIGAARLGLLIAADPNNPDRRILAVTKTNIAVRPRSLAYRLAGDPDSGCARVDWQTEPVRYTADELLTDPTEREDRAEREAEHDVGAAWLREYLTKAGGEAAAADIFRDGARAGLSQPVLRRARKRARIRTRKRGMSDGWIWEIATDEPAEDDEGDTEGDEDA